MPDLKQLDRNLDSLVGIINEQHNEITWLKDALHSVIAQVNDGFKQVNDGFKSAREEVTKVFALVAPDGPDVVRSYDRDSNGDITASKEWHRQRPA